jgi:hypothetical protein
VLPREVACDFLLFCYGGQVKEHERVGRLKTIDNSGPHIGNNFQRKQDPLRRRHLVRERGIFQRIAEDSLAFCSLQSRHSVA